MLTEAYNQNVSVQRGKKTPISGKIFYTKNQSYSNARLIKCDIPRAGVWLHVTINTQLHKVSFDLPFFLKKDNEFV